ncbi:site-2 protease family protein [Candidatus Clostridium radicumherbarum]|uniref:Site-2 protease family protein n=1 Tax=Candidatus Clostridium radicumherbarum TaxID=3381662 RepID=A0ABW8TNJ4_9CLOT
MRDQILTTVLLIPGILLGLTFHEFAHAYVADKLGDKTPRFQGRLTLNPLVHIDVIGFIMILIVHFGWAKPVQTNPSAYKNYYKDDLKVSIAGPLANLVIAFLSALVLALYIKLNINLSPNLNTIIYSILYLSVDMNCMLFVLNLIPIPGFDGFHILRDLFPKLFYNFSDKIYQYQFIIMIVFLVSPLSTYIIQKPADFIGNLIINIVSRI